MHDVEYPLAAAALIAALALLVAVLRSFRPIRFDLTLRQPKEQTDEHDPDGR